MGEERHRPAQGSHEALARRRAHAFLHRPARIGGGLQAFIGTFGIAQGGSGILLRCRGSILPHQRTVRDV